MISLSIKYPGDADLQTEHERYLTEADIQTPGICNRLSERDQGILHED